MHGEFEQFGAVTRWVRENLRQSMPALNTHPSPTKAPILMESVLYCIREYIRNCSHGLLAKKLPAEEAYTLGQEIVIQKVQKLQTLSEYHTDYELLLENICHIVLANLVNHIIAISNSLINIYYTEQD